MFDVRMQGDRIVCLREYRPQTGKEIDIAPLRCQIELRLGIGGGTAAAKALLAEFRKTFDQDIRRDTQAFERNVAQTCDGIVKFLKAHPEHRERRPAIVVEQEKYLAAMWDKYCVRLAPEVAHRSLDASIRKLRAGAPDLEKGKVAAIGRALSVPVITIVSGAVAAAASGGAAALIAAGLKVVGGALRATQDVGKSVQKFGADHAALQQDIAALRAAVTALGDRVQRLERSAQALRLEIAGLAAEAGREEKLVVDLERRGDAALAPRLGELRGKVADRRKAIAALESRIVNTEPLGKPLRALVLAMQQLDGEARRGRKDSSDALRATRDLVDLVKESASIADKLAR